MTSVFSFLVPPCVISMSVEDVKVSPSVVNYLKCIKIHGIDEIVGNFKYRLSPEMWIYISYAALR